MLKNGLALIGLITVCRYGYKGFRALVDWKVKQEVAEKLTEKKFELPA